MNVPLAFQKFTDFRLGNVCTVSTDCEAYHACINETECVSCEKFCIEDSTANDRYICGEDCQDYLHDFIYQYIRRREVEEIVSEYFNQMELVVILALLVMSVIIFITLGLFVYENHREKLLRMIGIKRQQLSRVENADDETTTTTLLNNTNPFYTQSDQEMANANNIGCSSVWDEVFDNSDFVTSDDVMLIPEKVTTTLNVAETKL